MFSEKTVYVLLQDGKLSSVHDSKESAEETLGTIGPSQSVTVIDGPWMVHTKKA